METCLYADGVRVLRQKEYDNMARLSLLTSKWKWQNKANAQNAMFWSILRS